MEPLLAVLAVVAGLGSLTCGADRLIVGACVLARRARLSEAVVGATIVAGGTSLPELVASLASALHGQFGMAIGNVVGSNIFNVGAILGPVALVAPLAVDRTIARFDWWVMAAVTIAFAAAAVGLGALPSWVCWLFLLGWLGYIVWSVRTGSGSEAAAAPPRQAMSLAAAMAWIAVGIAPPSGDGCFRRDG